MLGQDEGADAMSWQPIETAPTREDEPFLILRRGVVIQVSWFEGRMYPDAREACVSWEDGITDAQAWMPLPLLHGWVMVPRVPTPEMLAAPRMAQWCWRDESEVEPGQLEECWASMIAAAPEPPK